MENNTTTPADTQKTPQNCRSPYRADKRQSKFSHLENCTVEVTKRQGGKTQINNPPPSNTHAVTATGMQVNILNTHQLKIHHVCHTQRYPRGSKQTAHVNRVMKPYKQTKRQIYTETRGHESDQPDNVISIKYELWQNKMEAATIRREYKGQKNDMQ